MSTQTELITTDAYHSHPAISNSKLGDFLASRRLYEGRYVTNTIPLWEPTKAAEIGDIIHDVILEGRALHSCVGVYPAHNPLAYKLKTLSGPVMEKMGGEECAAACRLLNCSVDEWLSLLKPGKGSAKATLPNASKDWILERLPLNPLDSAGKPSSDAETWRQMKNLENTNAGGKPYEHFVKKPEYDQMKEAVSVLKQSVAWRLIDDEKTRREYSIFWTDDHGMDRRCKIDFHRLFRGGDVRGIPYQKLMVIASDLKITAHHTPRAWQKYIEKNPRCLTQAAWYTEALVHEYGESHGITHRDVIWKWITLNPEPPFTPGSVCEHTLDPESMDRCRAFLADQLAALRQCHETGDFSEPYEEKGVTVKLNDWTFR